MEKNGARCRAGPRRGERGKPYLAPTPAASSHIRPHPSGGKRMNPSPRCSRRGPHPGPAPHQKPSPQAAAPRCNVPKDS